MKRFRRRAGDRPILGRKISLTEREIAADLHYPDSGYAERDPRAPARLMSRRTP